MPELVPEVYKQRFRNIKVPIQTFVEFEREKETFLDKWCSASKAHEFDKLFAG